LLGALASSISFRHSAKFGSPSHRLRFSSAYVTENHTRLIIQRHIYQDYFIKGFHTYFERVGLHLPSSVGLHSIQRKSEVKIKNTRFSRNVILPTERLVTKREKDVLVRSLGNSFDSSNYFSRERLNKLINE
jgi:hypothetical protein